MGVDWHGLEVEAARVKLTPRKLMELARTGVVPAAKIGRRWLFDPTKTDSALLRLLDGEVVE